MSGARDPVAAGRLRAGAQLLHRPSASPDVADLVRRLLAVQAQEPAAAPLALRARATGLSGAAVAAAREDRAVVRAWGPRGTLHLVAAEDLAWLVPLVGPPRVTAAHRRLAQEGVADLDAVVPAVERVLAGAGPLPKEALGGALRSAGVPATGQAIVHAAALAAYAGRVVLGPEEGGRPTYVHAGDWLGAPIAVDGPGAPDRAVALAELARRYLAAHAPATAEDLAAWSGLPRRDARAGWAAIAGELAEVAPGEAAGGGWRLRDRPLEDAGDAVRLLPAFDELLLGWRSRDAVVPPAHARAVHPGGGILRAVVVAGGTAVATWSSRRAGRLDVTVAPFPEGGDGPARLDALEAEAADLAAFLGLPAGTVAVPAGGATPPA